MPKSYVIGEGANLYDPDSGAFVGVIDKAGKETMLVSSTTDPLTGGITIISKLTQAQYDAIVTKDDSTLYVIVP